MSGTSLDGIDFAYCRFNYISTSWNYTILNTKHIQYTDSWLAQFRDAIKWPARKIDKLDQQYGEWIGHQLRLFIESNEISPDLIASHGHTIYHKPHLGQTKQIGDGQVIADLTQIITISDFRSLDVSLGGQGAPLVPIGDRDLFREFDFCLNLGGISNISFQKNEQRLAYDIGIANMLLNHLSQSLNSPFDKDGNLAKSGKLNIDLLNQLNELKYYRMPFPKSTGYEWFRDKIIPIIENSKINTSDKLATSCHHIAEMISKDILNLNTHIHAQLLITGGGAKNTFLIDLIRNKLLGKVSVSIPKETLIDYKEALIFAFLGIKRIRNEINCLKSVTGAQLDSSGGEIYYPR